MNNECYNPEIKLLAVATSSDLLKWWDAESRNAPYWRLYWNDAPGAFVEHRGRSHALGPGKIVLLSPNVDHKARCVSSSRQFYAHFLAARPYAGIKPVVLEFQIDKPFQDLLKRAFDASSENNAAMRLKSLLAMQAVSAALTLIPEKLLETREIDPRVAAAMDKLAPGLAARGNEELAKDAGMSPNAFLRLFRKNVGTSPQLYNRTRRIEEACLLLHYSDLDIKSIAAQAGFCDRYHFSRVFKALRGVSPAEFRRKREQGEKS